MNWATVAAFLTGALTYRQVVGGWIDEDTPLENRVATSLIDGTEYKLVCEKNFLIVQLTSSFIHSYYSLCYFR